MIRWIKIRWHKWHLWNASYDLDFEKHTHHWNALLRLGVKPEELMRY